MLPNSALTLIALVAGVLYGVLALTLWVLLRHRHPTLPLALWVSGAVLSGLALAVVGSHGLHGLLPTGLSPGLAFHCLLAAMALRILALRFELGLPLRPPWVLAAWLLGATVYHLSGLLPSSQLRLTLSAMMLVAATLVFARHAVAVGQALGSRIGHGLAAAECMLALAITWRTAATLLHWTPLDDIGNTWDLAAASHCQ